MPHGAEDSNSEWPSEFLKRIRQEIAILNTIQTDSSQRTPPLTSTPNPNPESSKHNSPAQRQSSIAINIESPEIKPKAIKVASQQPSPTKLEALIPDVKVSNPDLEQKRKVSFDDQIDSIDIQVNIEESKVPV